MLLRDLLNNNFNQCIEKLVKIHEGDMRRIKLLEEINKELSDKQFKDKELQRLQDEVEHWRHVACQGFTIDDEEYQAIKEWKENHKHNSFYYKFVPTSIGDSGSIVCAKCGAEFEFKEIC